MCGRAAFRGLKGGVFQQSGRVYLAGDGLGAAGRGVRGYVVLTRLSLPPAVQAN
jgi:hypothetical protein